MLLLLLLLLQLLLLLLLQLQLFHPVLLRPLLLLPDTHACRPMLLMVGVGRHLFRGRWRLVGRLPRGLAHQGLRLL